MDDDIIDLDFENEFDGAVFNSRGETFKTYTARQRIEIAREEKWLDSAIADFSDDYGDFDDYYAVGYSN